MANENGHHHKKNLPPDSSNKNRHRKKSTLGLDDIIFKNTKQNEFDLYNAAKNLAKTMRIKQHVDKASKTGFRNTSIPFKKRAKMYAPGLKFKRSLTYYDVFLRLKHILNEDKIEVEYTVGDYGGCCQKPTKGEGWTTCLICNELLSYDEKDQHQEKHNLYKCKMCNSKNFENAQGHITDHHSFYCSKCDEFISDEWARVHIEIHSADYMSALSDGRERALKGLRSYLHKGKNLLKISRFKQEILRKASQDELNELQSREIIRIPMGEDNWRDGKIKCSNCRELFSPIQSEGVYLSMNLSW